MTWSGSNGQKAATTLEADDAEVFILWASVYAQQGGWEKNTTLLKVYCPIVGTVQRSLEHITKLAYCN